MKRAAWILTLTCLLLPTAAFADTIPGTVTFATSGSLGGGSSSMSFGSGANTLTVSYTGAAATLISPTFANLGFFTVSTTGTGATAPVTSFVLTIAQSFPGSGSGGITANLSGQIKFNSSLGSLTFTSPLTLTLAGVTYTLLSPNPLQLVPPLQGGVTTIQGFIAPPPVPEPASMMLFGTGLACAAGALRRRLIKS